MLDESRRGMDAVWEDQPRWNCGEVGVGHPLLILAVLARGTCCARWRRSKG